MIADDLRPQLNLSYGQRFVSTPNLDALAASPGAVVFTRAYAQLAWCSPSRNSFLTGRYPDTLHIWDFGKNFRQSAKGESLQPLPEFFKARGYLTLGGGKVYHPQQPPNNDVPRSWSSDVPYFEAANQNCPGGAAGKPGFNGTSCNGCPTDLPDETFIDWQIANWTVSALRLAAERRSTSPFFIAAGFHKPHVPWFVPSSFLDRYPADVPPPRHPFWAIGAPPCAFSIGEDAAGTNFSIVRPIGARTASTCRKLYYAAVSATDHNMGIVLSELEVLGFANTTVVIVTGDHGWHLGEGDQWAKYTTLEFGTRVPLIIRAPWIVPATAAVWRGDGSGARSPPVVRWANTFAELADLFPTLAELALPQAGLPEGVEGKSLAPALRAPETAVVRTSAASQFAHLCGSIAAGFRPNGATVCPDRHPPDVPSAEISYMGYAVRTAEWRFVEWYSWNHTRLAPDCRPLSSGTSSGAFASELYPHTDDDGTNFDAAFETRNVVNATDSGTVAQLQGLLRLRFPRAFANCTAVDDVDHAAAALGAAAMDDPYASHRNRTAANLLRRFNRTISLLAGAHAGANGFQPNGYSIIDENYFASKALNPYNTSTAAAIAASVASWLDKPGAAGWQRDRRENLWGHRTCANVDGQCTILGSYTPNPPLAGVDVPNSTFVVFSELNNNVTFTTSACSRASGMNINHCVPLLLALHLGGDHQNASKIFKQLLSTWDGIGFGPPKPPKFPEAHQRGGASGRCRTRFDALYTTRSFGYFLFAQRALSGRPGFEVPAATVAAMESALWKLQVCDPDGGGLPASYNTAGEPCCEDNNGGLTSIETGALSLLPYDPRVATAWFPPLSQPSAGLFG